MGATYPYLQKDRLLASDLNLDLELSPGAVPPKSAHSNARLYKQWIDTSVTPAVLRMCMVSIASAGYIASEWATVATIDTTAKKVLFPYLPLAGGTLTGPLILAANPTAILGAATKGYVDNQNALYLPLTGGTLSGQLNGTNVNVIGVYAINGNITLQRDANFTYLYDASTRAALELGGTSQNRNIYSNVSHDFYAVANASLFAQINANGISTNNTFQIKGTAFAATDASYTYIGDASGRYALYLGGSVTNANFYLNTTHYFETVGGGALHAQIDGAGVNTAHSFLIGGGVFANADGTYTYLYNRNGTAGLELNPNTQSYQSDQHDFYNSVNSLLYAYFYSGGCFNVNGSWGTISDIRTKENVRDYTKGLDAVCQLRPVTFQHNGLARMARDGRDYLGFVADELDAVMPELVKRGPHKLKPDDEPTELLMAEPTNVVYALVNAVRELADDFRELTARVRVLEGDLR